MPEPRFPTDPVPVPDKLYASLEEIRNLGVCNMFDRECVIQAMEYIDDESHVYLRRMRSQYGQILQDFGKWLETNTK